MKDFASLQAVDCRYIAAYDSNDRITIVVVTIKIYPDGTKKEDQLPEAFHSREKAYGACGQWEDQMNTEHVYAVRYLRQKEGR